MTLDNGGSWIVINFFKPVLTCNSALFDSSFFAYTLLSRCIKVEMDCLGNDLINVIASYFNSQALCRWVRLSKKTNTVGGNMDSIWQYLCHKRWREHPRIRNIVGAATWKMTYEIMSSRRKIPRGGFTDRHKFVGAFGRRAGCEAWVLIAHSPNTRLRSMELTRPTQVIELRVCFQNISHSIVHLNLCSDTFEMEVRHPDKKLVVFDSQCIARNGSKIYSSQHSEQQVSLQQLEFAVISMKISCPDEVIHETDFLSMAESLTINWGNLFSDVPESFRRDQSLSCRFIDEDTIWRHYIELPSSVILLREDCEASSLFVS